jgi:hypothetical protein
MFARADGPVVDLPADVDAQADETERLARRVLAGGDQTLPVLEKKIFELVLEQEGGSIRATAARMGVSRARVARVLAQSVRGTQRSGTWRRDESGQEDDTEEAERAG